MKEVGSGDAQKVIRVAFATDDGEFITGKHFGDARLLKIFDFHVSGQPPYEVLEVEPVGAIRNTASDVEEKQHGAEHKAKSVISLLMKHDVDVMVALRMGPNILRVKKFFLPVIVGIENKKIDDAVSALSEGIDRIVSAFEKVRKSEGSKADGQREFDPVFIR